MTADIGTVSVDGLDAAIAAATGNLAKDEQRVAATVLRLLSAGQPVTITSAAEAAGVPGSLAKHLLESRPAVFWDDQRRVTGFWGLTLAGMPPHRIRRGDTDLSTWCAWDPLFLARVIGDLDVATADPVTGEAITYRIGEDGTITGASHPDAVLSFRRPGQRWDDNVITSFCHYVLHFSGPATAKQWTTAHPGTFVISTDDAIELARRHAIRAFGSPA